jgi:hypothetical protein
VYDADVASLDVDVAAALSSGSTDMTDCFSKLAEKFEDFGSEDCFNSYSPTEQAMLMPYLTAVGWTSCFRETMGWGWLYV